MPTSEFEKKIHRWASLICCLGATDAWSGSESSATCWNWICRCLARVGSICNLLDMNLQMPIHQVDIKNPTTIAVGLFLCRKKSKMFSWTCGAYCAKI